MSIQRRAVLVFVAGLLFGTASRSQEISGYRILNITLTTSAPRLLAIDRGRLVWTDSDGLGKHLLHYYSGAETMRLDSNLAGVTAALQGDHVVWSTPQGLVKRFETRSWTTSDLGLSYNPDGAQPVSVAGDFAAFAVPKATAGSSIRVHRFSTGTDTLLSAGLWNTAPSLHHGQVAWVVSGSESPDAPSDIMFYDGRATVGLSGTGGPRNRMPVLRDAQVVWMESGTSAWRVQLFTGDSVITLLQSRTSTDVCTGYDLSDGIAVAAIRDTAGGSGEIEIYYSETGAREQVPVPAGAWAPHLDNGLLVYQSGTGPDKRLIAYSLREHIADDIAAAENPIVDDDRIAWTLGDAIAMYVPVTYQPLTTDGMNGWEQTKFKTIDSNAVVWGNFAGPAAHPRLFYSDGSTTTQLTDSLVQHDLLMLNDGGLVWRSNFDSLYMFDATLGPAKILDTIQAENLYIAGGSIGFFGPRIPAGELVKHPWLYRIAARSLTQLDTSSDDAWNVLVDGNTACWLNRTTERLMFFNGSTTVALSDSPSTYDYSYRNGAIVWSERRSGVQQIMLYDVDGGTRVQLTDGPTSKVGPLTDGSHVVWCENADYPFPPSQPVMWYHDLQTGTSSKVARTYFPGTSWNWMTDGALAWSQSGNLVVYDGKVLTQLTADDFQVNSDVYLDRGMVVWKRAGNIYRGKLRPHAAFEAFPVAGDVPLRVAFTNRSWEGSRTSHWDFGDGSSSTAEHVTHTYLTPGVYTVMLTTTGPTGTVTERKPRLIRVTPSTGVVGDPSTLPGRTTLMQNYPNPFNPETEIRFQIAEAGEVTLTIYDLVGREMVTLVHEEKPAGTYTVHWKASNASSGVYFCRLSTGSVVETKRLMVVR